MRLTTKGRYAVTAMLDLAIHSGDHPVNLNDISERQAISLSYLEQLFAKLKRENLVKSIRGPGGGYRLNGNSHDISVANIINAVNESMDVTRCEGLANCHDGKQCLTHNLWIDLSNRIYSFLNNISIGELIEKNDKQVLERNLNKETHNIELTPIK